MSAAYPSAARISPGRSAGYPSYNSPSVAPSLSLRTINSTGIRVPSITGLPPMTSGQISTRGCFMEALPVGRELTIGEPKRKCTDVSYWLSRRHKMRAEVPGAVTGGHATGGCGRRGPPAAHQEHTARAVGRPVAHRQTRARRFEKPAPDARAAPPEAHELLISRKTGAEVPLTGLSLLARDRVLEDVGPFLERPQDASLITRENLLALLEGKNKDF